jgi:ATP-dependent DNA helicase DinG
MSKLSTLGEFIALDFETTGLLPGDTIIEIGAIHVINGIEHQQFHTLINPQRPLTPEITQLTGITNSDVVNAPCIEDVQHDFYRFLTDAKGSPLPIMAHNAEFEKRFLLKIFEQQHGDQHYQLLYPQPPMLDTKDVLALVYPLAPSLSLEYFITLFGIRDFEHHRGLQDALDMLHVIRCVDEVLDQSRYAPLCAIVEYWFQHAQRQWLWLPLFAGRHSDDVPEYRNFKAKYASMERSTLPSTLSNAPARLQEQEFFKTAYAKYQLRPAQQQMAERASQTLNDGGIYIVEAETGTGKTLAYLSAAISALAADSSSPVVISTHTKALQNQFLEQELPRLQQLYDIPMLRAVALKGMSNYACLRKIDAALPDDERLFPSAAESLYAAAFLMRWLLETNEGELEELPRPLHEYPLIQQVAEQGFADFRDCTRHECSFYEQCFYFKKQWESQSAHILAVNHSLLLTYPKSYPEFDRLIVDEADELLPEAVKAFSRVVARLHLQETIRLLADQQGLITQVYNTTEVLYRDIPASQKKERALNMNLADVWSVGKRTAQTLQQINAVLAQIRNDDMFVVQTTLNDARISSEQRLQLITLIETLRLQVRELIIATDTVLRAFSSTLALEPPPEVRELQYRLEDMLETEATLQTFLEQDERSAALYFRIEKHEWSIVVTPYTIGELFATTIASKLYASVFTSATISSTRDMQDFIKGLGLHLLEQQTSMHNDEPEITEASEFQRFTPRTQRKAGRRIITNKFHSPFNYRENSTLIFLKHFPANNQPQFPARAAEFIAQAALQLGGRTLVLFTSKARLQQVHTELFPRLQAMNIELISHGVTNASQIKCVNQFKTSPAAVLMGARGLWKGVDIPGDDLQCLILEKMPYAVPNPYTKGLQDAIIQRYIEQAKLRHETPDEKRYAMIAWNEVDKPLMFQAFRQMFGRLIRTETDKGVMIVLDSQLQSGNLSARHKQLLELLPHVPYALMNEQQALNAFEFLRQS